MATQQVYRCQLPCDIEPKQFSALRDFTMHMFVYHNLKYPCDKCYTFYKSKKALKEHKINAHSY